ncbi:hypothetical protein E2C01_041407 [Portunus trituberculatus]|uniref:Uncharacterized protein n=1 Tax=Portunus trituberculatus TaxID=210409 RepID=A0A5B7FTH7_PORTR|nr:hypothetical protein [Portunus trituberculatus]
MPLKEGYQFREEGKTTLNPTPASDLDPSIKTGMLSEWVEKRSKNRVWDKAGEKSFLPSMAGGHNETKGSCQ